MYIFIYIYINGCIHFLQSPVDSSFLVGLNKYLTLEGGKQNKRQGRRDFPEK